MIKVLQGDCREILATMPDCSVDSIVTDPPYGLSFMGKHWDYDVPGVDIWRECLRVLKPGGHLLSFAGTRTQHRMACAIEDAGFEIRDMIAWVYGSGFPKSLDVSKAIESNITNGKSNSRSLRATEQAGDGEPYTLRGKNNGIMGETRDFDRKRFTPATPEAEQWQGWGTALKPALEPITVARKPLIGTVAENVLAHGTGAINVDGCRIGTDEALGRLNNSTSTFNHKNTTPWVDNSRGLGRWPANLIHDGSDEVKELFPETKSGSINGTYNNTIMAQSNGDRNGKPIHLEFNGDSGSAARFFYCAKASKKDRDEGLEGFEEKPAAAMAGNMVDGQRLSGDGSPIATPKRSNIHPTVKPTDLMRYLVRLVTPPGGIVLDPFAGSGSTGVACAEEGFGFIGIEREAEYCEIARARIENRGGLFCTSNVTVQGTRHLVEGTLEPIVHIFMVFGHQWLLRFFECR